MEHITILRGPDRIRLRPAVIFLSDGLEGLQNAIRPLLNLFATEAQLGHCKNLEVLQQGERITIRGNDRGMRLEDGENTCLWRQIFCDLSPAPRNLSQDEDYFFRLQEPCHALLFGEGPREDIFALPEEIDFWDLGALQAVCHHMEVTSVRDGQETRLSFCKGHPQGEPQKESTQKSSGTCFDFTPDSEVFTETWIPRDFFLEILQHFSLLSPGLRCTYSNLDTGIQETFYYPGGIASYIQSQHPLRPAYDRQLTAEGRERYNHPVYTAEVRLCLAFIPDGGFLTCLHNFRPIDGGTHLDAVLKRLTRAVNLCFRLEMGQQKELTFAELRPHVALMLVSYCSPRSILWESGKRQGIRNQMIADMAQDLSAESLTSYVFRHKNQLRPVIGRILQERK